MPNSKQQSTERIRESRNSRSSLGQTTTAQRGDGPPIRSGTEKRRRRWIRRRSVAILLTTWSPPDLFSTLWRSSTRQAEFAANRSGDGQQLVARSPAARVGSGRRFPTATNHRLWYQCRKLGFGAISAYPLFLCLIGGAAHNAYWG